MSDQQAVIITGSSGGIGQGLCRIFANAGYYVVGVDIVPKENDWSDSFVQCDLSRLVAEDKAASALFTELKEALAERSLTTLINNAAIQIVKPTLDLTLADWEQSLNVNVLAAFVLSQGVIPELKEEGGNIINIGSIHARLTKPKFVAYATSKAALEGMTRAMAVDLGPDVRVNAISPAAIETEMLKDGFRANKKGLSDLAAHHPSGSIGKPEEIAELALFLASERAQFMTGEIVNIDGAISARLHDPI